MATSSWIINDWKSGSCPEEGFETGRELFLREGEVSCTLVWVNRESKLCWIEDLPQPVEERHVVPVYFGSKYVPCGVSLTRSGMTLTGTLVPEKNGNDGNAGTFGAEGNGPFLED